MEQQNKKTEVYSDSTFINAENLILKLFLSNYPIDVILNKAVNVMGEYLDATRVFYYKYYENEQVYRVSAKYYLEPTDDYPDEIEIFPSHVSMHETLLAGRFVREKDSARMEPSSIKKVILNNKVDNFCLVPIFDGTNYLGYLGFDNIKDILMFEKYMNFLRFIGELVKKTLSKRSMQKRLETSEHKYKNLFSNMSAVFTNCELLYDENGKACDYRFLEVNSKFEKIAKHSERELVNRSAREIFTNIEEDLIIYADKVLKTGEPADFESYSIPFKKHFQFLLFKSSENTFAILSYDITNKKKTEKALVESEKKYRNLFESMTIGFANHEMIYDDSGTPVDYKYIEVNDTFKQITNRKDEPYVGKTIKEIAPNVSPEWIGNFAKVSETGNSVNFDNYSAHLGRHHNITAFKTSENGFATMLTDITYLKQVEHQLSEEKELLKLTLTSISDGVITTDIKGRITLMNKEAESLTGYSRKDTFGKPICDVFDIHNITTGELEECPCQKALKGEKPATDETVAMLESKNGKNEYIISCKASPIKDKQGQVFGSILVFRDVTESSRRNDEIKYLSMHDTLTGLYNRTYFESKMKEFDNNRLYPFSIIMGDANGLKITNDVFGHNEGDRLLKLISKILVENSGPSDIVARWGGDEFVILLPQADSKVASEVCKRITAACKEIESQSGEYSACPSISLGYATRFRKSKDLLNVIKTAEDYMYKRKLLESKSAHSTIVDSMNKTLYEKSHETKEHAGRLSKYCCELGKMLNLSDQDIYELEVFSMLHDIGKVALEESILTKKEKLTDSEWKEIRRHPEIGYRIASSVPELSQVAQHILSHHEKWDGTGYPQGLSGDDIPMQARILSLVDAFDAMTHDRPYRNALSLDTAADELIRNRGSQFDPQIVDLFMQNILPQYEV